MKILSPSLLSANFACLESELDIIKKAGAQYIHLDIMDGHFVPNITFGAPVVKKLRPVTDLVFDVHLMIDNPDDFIDDFAKAGADIITVHAEACTDMAATLQHIRDLGIQPAVALRPKTPISVIESVLPMVDMVMLMTVEPGFGGQKLIPETLDKIRELAALRDARGYTFPIEIDGGATIDNAQTLLDCGTDIIVAGSAVFGAPDVAEATRKFMEILQA